jgi:hypothetical protein
MRQCQLPSGEGGSSEGKRVSECPEETRFASPARSSQSLAMFCEWSVPGERVEGEVG